MSLRAQGGVSFRATTERIDNTPLAPLGEGNERRDGKNTPLAPLGEGSIEIPLRQPADRNDKGSAIGKVIAKCHSERREESLSGQQRSG